jgi:hypothetical protein
MSRFSDAVDGAGVGFSLVLSLKPISEIMLSMMFGNSKGNRFRLDCELN